MNNIPYFEIYKDSKDERWHWRCKSVNNCIIARGSEEGYSDKWGCRNSVKQLINVLKRSDLDTFEIRNA